jgi:hypothetical protein
MLLIDRFTRVFLARDFNYGADCRRNPARKLRCDKPVKLSSGYSFS